MSRWVHSGVRAVIFDAVGTLIFPLPSAPVVYAGTALRYGLDLRTDVVLSRFREAFRAEERADAEAGWLTSEEREIARWRRIVRDTLAGVSDPEGCFRELFDHFSKPSAWMVNPDAAEVLSTLQARGPVLGLASNYDSRLLSVIAGHGALTPLRDRVVVSAAVGYRKPAPQFFAEVARVAGCGRSEILLVGDDIENDYYGASGAGLEAVLLGPPRDYLVPPPVARAISSLTELI
jgi:putative hydrolase of the HAD superfamily